MKIYCVTPRSEGSTRGNRRMPLDGSQLPETHPRIRKAFSTITRLKNETLTLPFISLKCGKLINQLKSYRKFDRTPFVTRSTPCQENINKNIYIKSINPLVGYSSSEIHKCY